MALSGEVTALIREMDASQQAFDRWAMQELDVISSMAKQRDDQVGKSQREVASLQSERLDIERRINQLKAERERQEKTSKAQAREHLALRNDLDGEAKALKELNDLCFLLQTKKDRLSVLHGQSMGTDLLRALETLYGLSASQTGDSTTFTFQHPEAVVTIQEDENRDFRLVKAPVPVLKRGKQIMSEFNETRDLLTFLTAIRRAFL
jgi:predicted RNase H-like nuclease (RuvC/YqgF family)